MVIFFCRAVAGGQCYLKGDLFVFTAVVVVVVVTSGVVVVDSWKCLKGLSGTHETGT